MRLFFKKAASPVTLAVNYFKGISNGFWSQFLNNFAQEYLFFKPLPESVEDLSTSSSF